MSYVRNCRVSTIIISHIWLFSIFLFGIPFGKASLDAMLRNFLSITLNGPAIQQPGNVLQAQHLKKKMLQPGASKWSQILSKMMLNNLSIFSANLLIAGQEKNIELQMSGGPVHLSFQLPSLNYHLPNRCTIFIPYQLHAFKLLFCSSCGLLKLFLIRNYH